MGYTFKTLHEAVQRGNKITELPSACQPNHRDSLASNLLPSGPGSEGNRCVVSDFSITALHKYLVRCVVANNQV